MKSPYGPEYRKAMAEARAKLERELAAESRKVFERLTKAKEKR